MIFVGPSFWRFLFPHILLVLHYQVFMKIRFLHGLSKIKLIERAMLAVVETLKIKIGLIYELNYKGYDNANDARPVAGKCK